MQHSVFFLGMRLSELLAANLAGERLDAAMKKRVVVQRRSVGERRATHFAQKLC